MKESSKNVAKPDVAKQEGETLDEIYLTKVFQVTAESGDHYYFPIGSDTISQFVTAVKEHGGVWATPTHFVFLHTITDIKLWPKP